MNVPALQDYFYAQASMPKRVGVIDCCTFVVESLLFGWDRDFRYCLEYSDRKTAIKQLRGTNGLKGSFIRFLGAMESVEGLPDGSVIYFNKPPMVGLLLNDMVLVKGHNCVHRLQIESHMMGWRTDGS